MSKAVVNMAEAIVDDPDAYKHRFVDNAPFWAVHLLAVAGIIYYGWSWSGFALTMSVYFVMMFIVTGAMHRYFSHRTYKTSRTFQFILAVLGTCTTQKGVIWWAAHHRHHHKYSDEPEDVHSPRQRGFYWSHMGWILVKKHNVVHWDRVKDLTAFPELVFLQKYNMLFAPVFAGSFYLGAEALGYSGVHAVLWGFFVQQVLLWHGTFTINSFTHIWGRRRYKTTDDSRNSFLFSLITLGEGWHNNHHFYQRSTSQGFFWWEIDITYYILKMLSWVHIVSDVKRPPKHIRDSFKTEDSPELAPAAEEAAPLSKAA